MLEKGSERKEVVLFSRYYIVTKKKLKVKKVAICKIVIFFTCGKKKTINIYNANNLWVLVEKHE
jgi:hypothetical protein